MSDQFVLLDPTALADALSAPRPPVLVDVRLPAAFALGHVPGSLNIPVHDLGQRRRELPANLAERLIVIGDHRRRAVAAARFLVLVGFGDVALLSGGIACYDGPLETGPARPPKTGPDLRVVPSEPD